MATKKKVVKKIPEREYEMNYCKRCQGFVKKIVEDETIFRTTQRVLNHSGDYKWMNSDDYDGETTAIECPDCQGSIYNLTVNQKVFDIIWAKFEKKEDIFPCSYPEEPGEVIDEKDLFALML